MKPRHLNFGITLCILFCCVLGAGCSESSPSVAMSPPEDAFLSYWQCADSLVKGLMEIRSHEELIATREAIGAPDPMATRPMKDIFDELCNTLETYQSAVEQLPAPESEQLIKQHADLVTAVKAAVSTLESRNAKSPEILGVDCNRYKLSLVMRGADS